ncbi:hypothetical protein N0M98_30630 [Paenibacillus doosanensis]|uniref:hypothetical protein n=1 Tax=Paenibacillus doosanensis TaxID=1229154 RepID=UPI0021803B39|nr:hypothetical protein [Paenibacillus doosanensis]MCS7464458.1 hypothetical protein [Paenibacillus doosanensis]
MTHSIRARVLSIVICLLVSIPIFPFSLSAQKIQPQLYQDSVTNNVYLEPLEKKLNQFKLNVLKELPDLGTETSNTFLNRDGSKTVTSITYQTHDNKIRTELDDESFDYSNKKKNTEIKFGNRSNKPIKIWYGNYSISYQPILSKSVISQVYDDSIIYDNAWADTRLQYSVKDRELKMFLQLNSKNAPKEFKFEIDSPGLSYKELPTKDIEFFSKETGETLFTLPHMWVMGAKEKKRNYDQVTFKISPKNDNKTILSILIDDDNLTYPLLVDPSTIIGGTNFEKEISNIPFKLTSQQITYASFELYCEKEIYWLNDDGYWEVDWIFEDYPNCMLRILLDLIWSELTMQYMSLQLMEY